VKRIAGRYFFRGFEVVGDECPEIHSNPEPPRSHLPERKLPHVSNSESGTKKEYYEILQTQDERKCFKVCFILLLDQIAKIILGWRLCGSSDRKARWCIARCGLENFQ
jgi:hypothetical protein